MFVLDDILKKFPWLGDTFAQLLYYFAAGMAALMFILMWVAGALLLINEIIEATPYWRNKKENNHE